MPTKHKRKRDPDDKSSYDLPPTVKAKSLSVIAPTKTFLEPRKKRKIEASNQTTKTRKDDTPKQFARLMAWTQQGRRIGGGLDTGTVKKSQRKSKQKDIKEAQSDLMTAAEVKTTPVDPPPRIKPGETLTEFAIRVDQSLPLSSIPQSSRTKPSLPDDIRAAEKKSRFLTKHNKRLARMQAEWRNTEAKLKAREEEAAEENEEKAEEEALLWDEISRTRRKKGKVKVEDDDPWRVLKSKRKDDMRKRGLTAKDTVQAPPELKNLKQVFKSAAGTMPANIVPKKQLKATAMADVRRQAIDMVRKQRENGGRQVVIV